MRKFFEAVTGSVGFEYLIIATVAGIIAIGGAQAYGTKVSDMFAQAAALLR